jgi:uncharacterized protein DUF2846
MNILKCTPAIFLIAVPLFAQNQVLAPTAACGNFSVSMAVNLDDSQHSVAQPEPGKARIYFFQDTGQAITVAYPTTKIGIDGSWVGANKKDSYFSVDVDPGEHHLCAAIQSAFIRKYVELARLNAEAGKVYYYRTRIFYSQNGPEYFSFSPADSDEGNYLIESVPLATAKAKK